MGSSDVWFGGRRRDVTPSLSGGCPIAAGFAALEGESSRCTRQMPATRVIRQIGCRGHGFSSGSSGYTVGNYAAFRAAADSGIAVCSNVSAHSKLLMQHPARTLGAHRCPVFREVIIKFGSPWISCDCRSRQSPFLRLESQSRFSVVSRGSYNVPSRTQNSHVIPVLAR
jgi:hypothetical protein